MRSYAKAQVKGDKETRVSAQRKAVDPARLQFVDHRPETAQFQLFQDLVRQSPRAQQTAVVQAMADEHSARKTQPSALGTPDQNQPVQGVFTYYDHGLMAQRNLLPEIVSLFEHSDGALPTIVDYKAKRDSRRQYDIGLWFYAELEKRGWNDHSVDKKGEKNISISEFIGNYATGAYNSHRIERIRELEEDLGVEPAPALESQAASSHKKPGSSAKAVTEPTSTEPDASSSSGGAVAKPRSLRARPIPMVAVKEKSRAEKGAILETFVENIGRLKWRLVGLEPPVNEAYDRAVDAKIAEMKRIPETSTDTAWTLAYNALPRKVADYWKARVTYLSAQDGLTLIIAKARDETGYPVEMEKFNTLVERFMSAELAEFFIIVQSLTKLAPNRHDLLEAMDGDKVRETTGINCGKTAPSGFNTAVDAFIPKEPVIRKFAREINHRVMGRVVRACVEKTRGLGKMDDSLRRYLIGRALSSLVAGEDAERELDGLVSPKVIGIIRVTLFEHFTPDAVVEEVTAEVSRLGLASMEPKTAGASVSVLNDLARSIGVKEGMDLLGPDFVMDFVPVISRDMMERIAIQGGLVEEVPEVAPEVASKVKDAEPKSSAGMGASAAVAVEEAPTKFLVDESDSAFPKSLANAITIIAGTGKKDNLYVSPAGFGPKSGFKNEVKNKQARDQIRATLLTKAARVLRFRLTPVKVAEAITVIKATLHDTYPYNLGHAENDFLIIAMGLQNAISMHDLDHDPLKGVK